MFLGAANATRFLNDFKAGIYFEHQGPVKLKVTDWQLVTYYNLSTYQNNEITVERISKYTYDLCSKITKTSLTVSLIDSCINLRNQTDKVALRLKGENEHLYNIIGYQLRGKRSIMNTISKAAHVLYGICDMFCGIDHSNKIEELNNNNKENLHSIEENLRVIKVGMERIESLNKKMLNDEKVLSKKIKELSDTIVTISNATEVMFYQQMLVTQFLLINGIFDQYTLDTNLLSDIIHMAQLGKIHSSILSPSDLVDNLKEIKMTLPTGTDLPVGFSTYEAIELLKLSEVVIYFRDMSLVFVIKIPIVNQNDLSLYNVLPAPVREPISNIFIYIKPGIDYLALRDTKEYYTSYTHDQIKNCKRSNDFILCPQHQINLVNSGNISCEMSLMINPNKISNKCQIMYVQLINSILYKIKNSNKWLGVIENDQLVVTCNSVTTTLELQGTGILTLDPHCKGYTSRELLIPSDQPNYKLTNWTTNLNILNFIDKDLINSISNLETRTTNTLFDIYDISISTKQIIANKHTRIHINNILYHTVTLYVLIFFIVAYILMRIVAACKKLDCSYVIHPMERSNRQNHDSQIETTFDPTSALENQPPSAPTLTLRSMSTHTLTPTIYPKL